jgi:CSLREA domain-containing protein
MSPVVRLLGRFLLVLALTTLAVLGALGPVPIAQAATITVTTTADEYDTGSACSLREAIQAANDDAAFGGCSAGTGSDSIVVPAGTYTIALPGIENLNVSGDFDIRSDDVTINGAGAGATVVDGAQLDRLFDVDPAGTSLTARFSDLTIRNGNADGDSGGGILNNDFSSVEVTRVALTGNTSTFAGGGLDNFGTATVVDSVFSGNSSTDDRGGGLENRADASLTVINTTVSGNTAEEDGGGIRTIGDAATLNNVTVTNNTADAVAGDAPGDGGGISVGGGDLLTISNSIVAGNHDPTSDPDCSGTLTSAGFNLIGQVTAGCTFTPTTGDKTGTSGAPLDPVLGALGDNGGPTQTHALLTGSPAIDAGNPAPPGSGGSACAATDQRGLPRNCDIGAYELVLCGTVPVNRIGTSGNDALTGTEGDDGFVAQGGNDSATGLGGNDAACMGDGKDTAAGGGGKDRLLGEGGKDKLKGQGGKDRLKGGPGKDTCNGGPGRDKASCEKERSVP